MGNCKSVRSSDFDEQDDKWKRQTRGKQENKLYSFVDLKGEQSDALLVEAFKKGGLDEVNRLIREEGVFLPYLYNNGKGKVATKEEFLSWKRSNGEIQEKNEEEQKKMDYPDHLACWSLEHRGTLGETALHLCFLNNKPLHRTIAHALLEEYPTMAMDKYEGDEFYGETCLHIAIVNNDLESVKLLVDEYNADVHAAAKGAFFLPEDSKKEILRESNYEGYAYYGEYPASFAACFNDKDMYDFLIRRNADPNKQDSFGNTVLHMCVVHNNLEMYKHALHRKHKTRADPHIANKAGYTPLALAARLGRQEMFQPMMEQTSVQFWTFGPVVCTAYPLEGLDSISKYGKSDDDSALMLTLQGKTREHLEMLNTGIMYRLLEEKWNAFAKRKFYTRMLFAVLYLICFSLAIYLRPRDPNYKWSVVRSSDVFRLIMEVITVLGAIIFLILEIKDVLISQGLKAQIRAAREAPGKTIFLCSCVLVIVALPFRYCEIIVVETHLMIVAAPMAWCYMLFFCRGFAAIGPFVDMVYKMCAGDMSRFVIIFTIFLLGLAQAFSHLMKGVGENWKNEGDTILNLLSWAFGDFDYIELEKSHNPTLAKMLFFYFMLFITVLLLNMLIAMMASTYQNIADHSEKEWRKQWAEIIMVLERTVSHEQLMRYQDEYSVNLASDPGGSRSRGIMVIRLDPTRSRVDARKAAKQNWQILGKLSNKKQLSKQGMA